MQVGPKRICYYLRRPVPAVETYQLRAAETVREIDFPVNDTSRNFRTGPYTFLVQVCPPAQSRRDTLLYEQFSNAAVCAGEMDAYGQLDPAL